VRPRLDHTPALPTKSVPFKTVAPRRRDVLPEAKSPFQFEVPDLLHAKTRLLGSGIECSMRMGSSQPNFLCRADRGRISEDRNYSLEAGASSPGVPDSGYSLGSSRFIG